MLPVQFVQTRFEVIAHERDRQVGGALHDARAQRFKSGAEFRCALHVDRLNAHATVLEIFLRVLRQQAEARPIGVRMIRGRARCRDHEAAVAEPLQGFVDLIGWKIFFQLAKELPKVLAGSYRGCERAIERAVEKELPVLGIETHDIRRQHIDGKIRRELRNVFAVTLRKAALAIACPQSRTRASTLAATSLDRHWLARSLLVRRRRRPARAQSGIASD